jgi:hypothetical protein
MEIKTNAEIMIDHYNIILQIIKNNVSPKIYNKIVNEINITIFKYFIEKRFRIKDNPEGK